MYRGRVRRPVVLLMVAVLALSGCTRDEPEATPTPAAQPTPVEEITLTDLGIGDWPAASAPFPEAPARPEGVTKAEYDRMVTTVETWARQAATAPTTVGDGLPPAVAATIATVADEQAAPSLARGTVLDPALEVLGSRMTSAWKLSSADGSTNLSLQTRAAYEVRAPDGPVRVIGVLRTQGVIDSPDSDDWGTVMGWQEFGAADCATALDDFLTPGGDADDQESDLSVFVEIGNGTEAVTPAIDEDEVVNEEFLQRCRAGRI